MFTPLGLLLSIKGELLARLSDMGEKGSIDCDLLCIPGEARAGVNKCNEAS